MERPVKLYNGVPERGAICRLSQSAIARVAKKMLAEDESKRQVDRAVKMIFAADEIECIESTEKKFSSYGCYSFSDIGVMLRWQEALLHSCEKWGKSTVTAAQEVLPAMEDGIDEPQDPEEPFSEPEIEVENI